MIKFHRMVLVKSLILLLSFILCNKINAQVFNGNLTLATQAQVDAFNYTIVTGTVTISQPGLGDIHNLNGLSELTTIGGYLNINSTDSLNDITGLSNLSELHGLTIGNNNALDNLDGLSSIDSIFGNVNIAIIGNINGLSNLVYIEGKFELAANVANLNALSQLKYVGTTLELLYTNITNLDGLSNLEHVGGILLTGNANLININVLSGFTSFSTAQFIDNRKLDDISGLANLVQVNSLRFTGNRSLSNFCPLYKLFSSGTASGTVTITNNKSNPTPQEIVNAGPCGTYNDSFIAVMLGNNEVPPIETESSGGGMYILNETKDTLHFWIRVCELDCPFTAAYFYQGAPGVAGNAVKTLTPFFTPDTMGSFIAQGIWTSSDPEPLTPALVTNLIGGTIYVNVHTTGYPNGEIRGQLTSNKPVELFANLEGLQEVPPVNTMGSGEGHFTLSGDGDSLWYNIMFGNLSGPVVASHFHKAAFGVPGPVVRGFTTVGDSSAEGVWTNMDAQPLTPQLVADLLGCFIYVNVHTQQHPAGEIRGQIFKSEGVMKQYMTIWAAENDENQDLNSKLNFYSLAQGNQFLNHEGEIYGYNGKKNIVDLTIDTGGDIYFLNNSWTSMIYKIKSSAVDLNESTPVYAKQIGRTRTYPDEKLVWLTHIQFIRGKLYGLDSKTNKLYQINTSNAYVKEIITLDILDKMASGFALGADGNVYLLKTLDNKKSEIWKFEDFPGNSLSLVTGISSLDMLESFASHPNGKLYAADKSSLYEIDLSQKTVGVLQDHQVSISAMDFDTYTEKNTEPVATVTFTDVSGVTAVEGFTSLPKEYSLSQNYPNPFNPNTTIKYQLPEAAFVKLKVYNSLGELVKTLVSETKDAGYYEISFDASSLSSGMYIYKIEAGNFVSSNKMILLK